jgi:hypothetical protein
VLTNKAALQKASQQRQLQETALRQTLTRTALERGWPLTIRNKKGRMAYLRGINSNGLPYYITTTDNIVSAATIGTTRLWPGGSTGLALNGSSANMKGKIAVWDEGRVRPTHVELAGRVIQVDNSPTLSDHSTHVSGTMIAAGVNPLARGMSFGAQQLLAYDFTGDESEMMTAAASGLLVSSHSYADIAGWYFDGDFNRWEFWGNVGDTVDIRFGLYDQDAQIWDSIAYNAPDYLIVKAGGNNPGETGPAVGDTYYRMNAAGDFINAGRRPAGISNNAGYNTIATYGNSKNILTLGAVNPIPGGYSRPSDVVLADFSSLGPSGDGRIKPDVVADGVNVMSSISTADNAYDIYSGTSMATPASAGSSFLLQEYYSKLHGGTFMRSATLKGLLIHTADEAGSSPGPDYAFGWGLIDMPNAAAVITADNTDHSQQITEASLTGATPVTYTITASGKTPIKATLCWTDPPGVPVKNPDATHNFVDAGIKLIDDLDLRIKDNVTNKIYMPWILDPTRPSNAATTGDNIRDNVERVEMTDSLIPGRSYTVTVSHKGTLQRGSQAYSLIISGEGGTAVCSSASTSGGASITQVKAGGLSNSTPSGACRTYTDYSALTAARLPVGENSPITIVSGTCTGSDNTRIISVFIDFNNNGTFEPNELAAQSTATQSGTFNGIIAVPVTAVTGAVARMRIIAEETTNPAAVNPCATYGAGETQDYRVQFTNPGNDVGVTALEYPTLTTAASDSQLVSIHIHNFGTVPQAAGIPVTTIVKDGTGAIVATLTANCLDSIPAGGEVIFTYNTTFQSAPGASYTFASQTALNGDGNTANDGNTSTITVNPASAAGTGTATLCGDNATTASLRSPANGDEVPLWYTSATASTPVAAGNSATASVIPADKTYYLGLSDLKSKVGPPNKLTYAATGGVTGDYLRFQGNFVAFTTSVPLTIESAKMYIGHSGQITFTLANYFGTDAQSGEYSYLPISSQTIDVYATAAHPDTTSIVKVNAGDNSDPGATFLLNISVPTPGDYILIIDCSNYASAFLNVNIPTDPYPISLPGVMSINYNSQMDVGKADSLTASHKFYFPFYDIGIRLAGNPSATRTAVTATPEAAPTVSISGNVLSSNFEKGNQWYYNDTLLVDSTGPSIAAPFPGLYYTVVTDSATGCMLISNKVAYAAPGGDANASIGLKVKSNPNNGSFTLQFFMTSAANTAVTLSDVTGKKVYEAQYPDFTGVFIKQINVPYLASGVYILKIIHGDKVYKDEVLIIK